MTPLRIRRLLLVSASLLPAALGAGTIDEPLPYELRPGSTLVDDCQNCDRAPIERSLDGTFTLTHVESLRGTVYALSDIDFRDPAGEYVVKGSGMYTINDDIDGSQELFLDVTVNGESGITLRGGRVEVPVAWPAIDITASQEPRGPDLRFFTIRIVASPPAADVPYDLVPGDPATQEGSFLLIVLNCPMCAVVPIRVPISGTFLLGQISREPAEKVYRVDRALFEGVLDGMPHRVEGSGTFEVSGDAGPQVRMRLVADIDGLERILDSGPIASPAIFPDIEVDLFHSSPQVPPGENFHGLEIVARPSAPHGMRFLRGDSNADNSVDIADPIHTLLWLFAGGTVPGCLDAADSDGDARVDITDPVFTLDYLFRSGPAPDAPGPDKCGPPPLRPGAGCVSPAPCEP